MHGVTTLPEAHPVQSRRWNLEAMKTGLSASTLRYTLYLYIASRLLFLAIAAVEVATQHTSLQSSMSHWDGFWYLKTTAQWYDHTIYKHAGQYETLGFMPGYPLLIWVIAHVTQIGNFGAGLLISLVSGGVATVLIGRLAVEWWGEAAGRRAILFWCFFPGTIVFSMVYTEGLQLALVSGAIILLQRKRWLWAGVLCGFATAIAPAALAVIPMCAVAAWRELRARGWHDRKAQRSLIAVILAPLGAIGFGIFLWHWTGTPFADYRAQHNAWSESSTPLAIPRVVGSFVRQLYISGVGDHGPGGIDLNGVAAILGTAFLLWGLWLLWQNRDRVPLTALVWTACVSVLALTSSKTPPNPRLLIVAFPVVMVVGATLTGRAYRKAMVINVALTLVMSYFTYVGLWLRP
jgi:hypothetical protein